MKCQRCHVSEMVVIEMQLAGESVALNSCSKCDHRWWQKDADAIPLAQVLVLAGTKA
jgi:DNA polymerase III alpha subunit (gram-positive type)